MRKQQIEPPRMLPARLWNIKEAAAFLGVPVSTLYYWSYRGEGGPKVLRIGKCLRYNPLDVHAWAEQQGT